MKNKRVYVIQMIIYIIALLSIGTLFLSFIALSGDIITPKQAITTGTIACAYLAISVFAFNKTDDEESY